MITITARPTQFKSLRPGDPDFTMSDGIKLVPRAGFEFGKGCPVSHQLTIVECINNGWLKPIAYMKDSEYTWELLQK
jgi:hypothetical protein